MSVASMAGAAVFAGATPLLYPGRAALVWAACLLFAFIVFTHRSNIGRLLAGTESRFGARNTKAGP
jgi:glycerol-3-phosphate acyltransferase PlsY